MREPAKHFEDLVVWQKAHRFVLSVYRLSQAFPRTEIYKLSCQFWRGRIRCCQQLCRRVPVAW